MLKNILEIYSNVDAIQLRTKNISTKGSCNTS